MAAARHYTAAQREEADRARREQIEQMHQQLAERMKTFDDRDNWQNWLTFSRNFHRYSFGNGLLIQIQAPHATLVAGYRAWQAKGHQVRKGEKAIKVMAPILRKEPLLDAAGNPVVDGNGDPRFTRELVGVKPASVFDASQVEPPPPSPPVPVLLEGQAPPGLWESLVQLTTKEGFTLQRGNCGGANGFTNFDDRVIGVRDDIDELAQTKTLIHEIGHVYTMGPAERLAYAEQGCRGLREVEAESVAYVVLQAHNVDSSQYTFNYVAGWASQASGGDSSKIDEIVRATGEKVITAAHRILAHTQPEPTAEDELIDVRADGVLAPRSARRLAAADRSHGRTAGLPSWETVAEPSATIHAPVPTLAQPGIELRV